MARNDILIPLEIEPAASLPRRSRLAALVPITIAVLGIAAILLGGISARTHDTASREAVDPVTTGSIPASPVVVSVPISLLPISR